jgi:hypothetical protein
VKALIEHNPDLNVRSLKGVCLIDAAKEKPELFEIIKKHMATVLLPATFVLSGLKSLYKIEFCAVFDQFSIHLLDVLDFIFKRIRCLPNALSCTPKNSILLLLGI